MLETMNHVLGELGNPQYRHLVLHPLFVHGLVLTGLFTFVSLLMKQRRAAALGLVLMAVCALSVWFYLHARAEALPAMQKTHSRFDATEMAATGELLARTAWVYFVLAGFTIFGLVAVTSRSLTASIFVLCIALGSMVVGVWGLAHHYRESCLYHPNLDLVEKKSLPPPPKTAPLPAKPATTPKAPQPRS